MLDKGPRLESKSNLKLYTVGLKRVADPLTIPSHNRPLHDSDSSRVLCLIAVVLLLISPDRTIFGVEETKFVLKKEQLIPENCSWDSVRYACICRNGYVT